jgi:hypothetical protein
MLGRHGRSGGRGATAWLVAGLALAVTGCSLDGLLGTDKLPPDVTDPALIHTPEGALRAYHGTLALFRDVFATGSGGKFAAFVVATGLLTDELESDLETIDDLVRNPDTRDAPEGAGAVAGVYSKLQKVRGQATQAIGLLNRYAPDSLAALTGHAYTLQAYAEIFLAELFCSGIPLSTLDYEGNFTYRPGSTTEEVYQHALALLDTALTLVGDSARFDHLARIGRARAFLGLGRFEDAAGQVAAVPDDYRYMVDYSAGEYANFAYVSPIAGLRWPYSVADREGLNGLDFVSSGDPRTQVTSLGINLRGRVIHHPNKYATDGSSSIVLASGTEARLIEAEAALWAGDIDGWLGKLNHLRRTAWQWIEPSAAGPLPDLSDPGDPEARVDLLFRERAFWLFLTGQRQGDLRRLIRYYGRTQDQVYPVGEYPHPWYPGLSYGRHVDLPIPGAERVSNPLFTGCISRD